MKKSFLSAILFSLLAVGAVAQPIRPWLNPGLSDPRNIGNLSAWYDTSYTAGLIYDSASRVSLISDRSGNSATNVLCLNGVSGNYASAPDSAPISFTSDLDVAVDVAANDYTPGSNQILVAKGTSIVAANLEYALQLNTGGTVTLYWSTGAATLSATSTSAVSFTDYSRGSIRATLDADNGAGGNTVTFYTATTFGTWSQLGTAVTTAGTTSIQNSTNALAIGSFTGGTSGLFAGRNYRTALTGTIGGTLAFDSNFATFTKLATSGTESSSNAATVTINSSGDTGARISGERDLVQLTASKQPIYLPWSGTNYGWLNAVSGNYFSSPDSAPISFASDLDVAVDVAANDYTPSGNQILVAKGTSVVPANMEYALQLNTGGTVTLYWSTGAATLSATSTSAVSFTDYSRGSIRATLDADNGAGGNTVTFYTATTFGTWSQLGTAVTTAGTTSIQNSTNALAIGSFTGGTSGLFAGRNYRTTLTGTIGGTLAFDMNPATYTGGATFTDSSSNAATITINGAAAVVNRTQVYADGSDDYMKTAAFALVQPETVELVGQQVTWTAGDRFYDGNTGSMLLIQDPAPSPQIRINAGSSTAINAGFALKTAGVVSVGFNGASSFTRVNRNAASTGNAGAANANGFTFASSSTPGSYGNITLSEAVIYSAALTEAQQLAFVNYAFVKWNL